MKMLKITCVAVVFSLTLIKVAQATDLSVTKDFEFDSVKPGEDYRYIIHVNNASAVNAINVQVSDTLPSEVALVSSSTSSSQGSCTEGDNSLQCDLGTIASGTEVTIEFAVTLSASAVIGSTVTNQATATADNEIDPTNNTGTASIGVTEETEVGTGFGSTSGTTSGCSLLRKTPISRRLK